MARINWPRFRKKARALKERQVEKAKKPVAVVVKEGTWPVWHPNYQHPKEKAGGVFYSGKTFGKALEKKGFKILGRGAYSTVFAKEGSDKVIKVTRREDGWIDYCHWASKRGYAGSLAPKVFSYKKIKGKEEEFAVSIVERMVETLHGLDCSHDMKVVGTLLDYGMRHANDNALVLADLVAPGLGKFAMDMKVKFKSHNFDLHGGNIMVRANGTLCVTDPICGNDNYDTSEPAVYTRLRTKDFAVAA